MSDSLRDQLLKAGLVTKKQAAQTERAQQYRGTKGRKAQPETGHGRNDEAVLAAKAARDRELNREQQAKVEARARRAALRQIIDQHRVAKPETDEYFNFVDGGKVRRIPVDADLRARLIAGTLLIARCDGRYELVPVDASARIRERDPAAIVAFESPAAPAAPAAAGEDPYRDFAVPDDLTW